MASPVIIFGATGAIGSATARILAREGYPLHLVGRDATATQTLAEELNAPSSTGDVLTEGFVQRAVIDAGDSLGGLVYAVGSITLKSVPRLKREDFLRDFELNVLSAAMAVQAAIPVGVLGQGLMPECPCHSQLVLLALARITAHVLQLVR